jgi:hypothetical protein
VDCGLRIWELINRRRTQTGADFVLARIACGNTRITRMKCRSMYGNQAEIAQEFQGDPYREENKQA